MKTNMQKFFQKNEATREFLRANFAKTELCSFYQRGKCLRGTTCNFAHEIDEQRSRPDLTKTCICENWLKGACPLRAVQCKFAHGYDDLRSTRLRAPRGPRDTKLPMPTFTANDNQKTKNQPKAKLERAGDVFEEEDLQRKSIGRCREYRCNLSQLPVPSVNQIATMSTLGTTMDSVSEFPSMCHAGSCHSTMESVPDFSYKEYNCDSC